MILKKSLSDEVAIRIREKIVSSEYIGGSKLPIEPLLMEEFGVGRSTVREAMKLLSNSGFVRIQQGVGTFVEDVTKRKKDITQQFKQANPQDVEEIRHLFELLIAEKAATNRTQKDIKNISRFLKERYQAAIENRLQDCIEADISFHIAVAVAAKNEILTDLYKSATAHVKISFSVMNDTDKFIKTHPLHQQLLDCIVEGNKKKARLAAEKILQRDRFNKEI